MNVEEILQDDADKRAKALEAIDGAAADERGALASALAAEASRAAEGFAGASDATRRAAVIERATRALALLDGDAARASLEALSTHPAPAVRKKLILGIFRTRNDTTCAILRRLVRDSEKDVRNDAADAVRTVPWAEVAEDLLAASEATPIPSEQVARALATAASLAPEDVQTRAATRLLAVVRSAPDQKRPLDRQMCLKSLDALIEHGASLPGVQASVAELEASADARTRLSGVALRAAGGDEAALASLKNVVAKGPKDEAILASAVMRIVERGLAARPA